MKYDVFLSFTGEDIRKTFLSHLVHSLDRKGIRSVTSAWSYPSDFSIAMESRVAISIISKSYTSLDLWVAQQAKLIPYKREAVPVFLRVDPVDVLKVLNVAKDSADIIEPRRKTLETVKNWLDGHVTRKSGFHSGDWEDDSQLVDSITCYVYDFITQDFKSGGNKDLSLNWVKSTGLDSTSGSSSSFQAAHDIPYLHRPALSRSMFLSPEEEDSEPSETINKSSWWGQLKQKINLFVKHTRPSETIESSTRTCDVSCDDDHLGMKHHPGMKHHVEEVLTMLRGDSTKEVSTIGICGMEGVGKTTLASFVYEEISPQFQHQFFIKNFSKQGSSLFEIIAGHENLETTTYLSESSIDVVMRDIVGRKVLLVADSVDDTKQLKSLTKEVSLFGPGSRVIVITNESSLLVQHGVEHIYEVGCLTYEEAIQLFSHFAYSSSDTLPRSHGLISRAVQVAGCIPLALKLLGSFLYGKGDDQWKSTLRLLEASHNKYSEDALGYIGTYDFKAVGPTILELEEDEANRYPLYTITLQ